jgi:hypothetical protein
LAPWLIAVTHRRRIAAQNETQLAFAPDREADLRVARGRVVADEVLT